MIKPDFQDFLSLHGWGDATCERIGSDWSPRQYWRLSQGDKRALLMLSVDPYFRGHTLEAFIRLNAVYTEAGLHVPQIYAHDLEAHMLLIEDFGAHTIDAPEFEAQGYETAVDALFLLHAVDTAGYARFEDGYIFDKIWLYNDSQAWKDAWHSVWSSLPPCPYVFSHMDYKAGNLHWLPHKEGIARLGVLDYQTAQAAPFVYDIVNLLEDARRHVRPDVKAAVKARFKAGLPQEWAEMFDDWYDVMSAQFHLMILGQMRSLNKVTPDIETRLKGYLHTSLKRDVLSPIRVLVSE